MSTAYLTDKEKSSTKLNESRINLSSLASSTDGQPMLLPPDQVQELNRRSTGMLNNVQRFFAHHLIEAFGCDYSTSGVTLEALQAKIKSFLELRTADGPRHDTYVIFYSGHTHRSGEWALAGKCPTCRSKIFYITQKVMAETGPVCFYHQEETLFALTKSWSGGGKRTATSAHVSSWCSTVKIRCRG